MKKNIIIIILFGFIILGLVVFKLGLGHISNNKLVSLEIKEETLTNTGATFVMKNNTKDLYSYGTSYYIEIESDAKWNKLEPINNVDFHLIGYNLKGSSEVEIKVDWEYHYGKLKPGKYRLVKDVFKNSDIPIGESQIKYISAEFVIK